MPSQEAVPPRSMDNVLAQLDEVERELRKKFAESGGAEGTAICNMTMTANDRSQMERCLTQIFPAHSEPNPHRSENSSGILKKITDLLKTFEMETLQRMLRELSEGNISGFITAIRNRQMSLAARRHIAYVKPLQQDESGFWGGPSSHSNPDQHASIAANSIRVGFGASPCSPWSAAALSDPLHTTISSPPAPNYQISPSLPPYDEAGGEVTLSELSPNSLSDLEVIESFESAELPTQGYADATSSVASSTAAHLGREPRQDPGPQGAVGSRDRRSWSEDDPGSTKETPGATSRDTEATPELLIEEDYPVMYEYWTERPLPSTEVLEVANASECVKLAIWDRLSKLTCDLSGEDNLGAAFKRNSTAVGARHIDNVNLLYMYVSA